MSAIDESSTDVDAQPPIPPNLQKQRAGRMIRWSFAVFFVTVIGFGAIFASRFGIDPSLVQSPLLGKPAPTFEAPYLEKEGVLKSETLTGQIVVLNFWASWCVACRAEHDDLVRASRAYEDKGVVFIGVDFQDTRKDAIAFLDEMGRAYDNVVDDGSRVAIEYGVYGIPETFFIDADGIVQAKIVGESSFYLLSQTLDAMLRGEIPKSSLDGYLQSPPGS